MFIRRLILAIAIPLASFLVAPSAQAACAALSLCSCTVTTSGIDFGNYNPVTLSDNDSSGTIRVRCTLLVALAGSYTIELSKGASATYAQRTLANGASILNYNVYTTNARNQIWGDGTGGSQSVTNNFSALLGIDQTTNIYGRIPAGQNAAAGPYSDVLIVTVIF